MEQRKGPGRPIGNKRKREVDGKGGEGVEGKKGKGGKDAVPKGAAAKSAVDSRGKKKAARKEGEGGAAGPASGTKVINLAESDDDAHPVSPAVDELKKAKGELARIMVAKEFALNLLQEASQFRTTLGDISGMDKNGQLNCYYQLIPKIFHVGKKMTDCYHRLAAFQAKYTHQKTGEWDQIKKDLAAELRATDRIRRQIDGYSRFE